MIHTVIEEQLSEPKDYGKIKITATLSPLASENMRDEAIQVAACAVAMIEAADGGRYG